MIKLVFIYIYIIYFLSQISWFFIFFLEFNHYFYLEISWFFKNMLGFRWYLHSVQLDMLLMFILFCGFFLVNLTYKILVVFNFPPFKVKSGSYKYIILNKTYLVVFFSKTRIFLYSFTLFLKKLFKRGINNKYFFWKPTFKKFSYFHIFKNNKNKWRDKK